MKTSVIIPSRNRPSDLVQALRCLARGCELPEEVIVVDDGSVPPLARWLEREYWPFPLRQLRHEAARGAAASRNEGIRAANGELLILLDDDVWPADDFLAMHRRIHARHPEPNYAVEGRLFFDPQLTRTPVLHYLEEFGWYKGVAKSADGAFLRDGLVSANFSIKRAFLENKRLFDESMDRSEDTEFGLRLVEQGCDLRFHVAPGARHHAPFTLASFLAKARRGGLAKAAWAVKRPDDTRVCLQLEEFLEKERSRKTVEAMLDAPNRLFGERFLEEPIDYVQGREFEDFRRFMDIVVDRVQAFGVLDGWRQFFGADGGPLKKLELAMDPMDENDCLAALQAAHQAAPDFLPAAIMIADRLDRMHRPFEALTVLAPFEHSVWVQARLARLARACGDNAACAAAVAYVLEHTPGVKAIEDAQRAEVADLVDVEGLGGPPAGEATVNAPPHQEPTALEEGLQQISRLESGRHRTTTVAKRSSGVIVWYSEAKGFGFIRDHSSHRLHFFRRRFSADPHFAPQAHREVTYKSYQGPKGLEAHAVSDATSPADALLPPRGGISGCDYHANHRELRVRGWFLGTADRIEIWLLGGEYLGQASMSLPRSDIYSSYPEYGNALSGWEFTRNVELDGAVTVVARAMNDQEVVGEFQRRPTVLPSAPEAA